MDQSRPSGGSDANESAGDDKFASAIPWGVYVPPCAPPSSTGAIPRGASDQAREDADAPPRARHGGHVRIVDARGKSFPCGFSRPVGYAMEEVASAGRKRGRAQMVASDGSARVPDDGDTDDCAREDEMERPLATGEARSDRAKWQRVTVTEERLHPEEALFLHMRGLLRIEAIDSAASSSSEPIAPHATWTTQELFCKMLPQCNVPLAAYLSYAHLRAQGYILMRYSEGRMELLGKMGQGRRAEAAAKDDGGKGDGESVEGTLETKSIDEIGEAVQPIHKGENGDGKGSTRSSDARTRYRPLRSKLSDDVASAPPPCVVHPHRDGEEPAMRLAYYAYNPNARFRRSDPGWPDFGVALMPFRAGGDEGPTFDGLRSLVSMCEGQSDGIDEGNDRKHKRGIPLRMVTVADGGAVIAFGLTKGDVPKINQAR